MDNQAQQNGNNDSNNSTNQPQQQSEATAQVHIHLPYMLPAYNPNRFKRLAEFFACLDLVLSTFVTIAYFYALHEHLNKLRRERKLYDDTTNLDIPIVVLTALVMIANKLDMYCAYQVLSGMRPTTLVEETIKKAEIWVYFNTALFFSLIPATALPELTKPNVERGGGKLCNLVTTGFAWGCWKLAGVLTVNQYRLDLARLRLNYENVMLISIR